ncbi:UNVERIFIED_CONTAM: hypothetical protein K2H54_000037 [Gekko kuhli]
MESPVKGDLCGLEQQDQLKTHTKMLRQAYRVCAKNEATIRELDDKIIFSSEPMEMQSLIQQRELLKSKTDKIEEEIVMLKQMVQKTTRELEGTNVGTSTVDDAHISNNSDVLQVSSEQHPITNIAAARRDPSSPIVISSSPEIYPAKRRKKGDEEKSTKRISKKSPRKEIESWGEFNCMFRGDSEDAEEDRGRGNHGNQRMAESEFEPMEETGGAGQAGQASGGRRATVLPSGPTPQGEYFEESSGPSSTVTSEGTEESVVEVEPERAQGQRKEPESIALVHPTPIPLPQRQSVKRKKPTTPNKEHSAETTDPVSLFYGTLTWNSLWMASGPQQHHILLTADTPELGPGK